MPKVSKKRPEKALLRYLSKSGGRNNRGRITVWHRGGGVKRLYRVVDFAQGHLNMPGKVVAIEYDPNRNARLALLEYENGERSYVLAPHELKEGDEIVTKDKTEIRTGNRMRIGNIPVGTMVYNVELSPDRGGKLVRGAGAAAQVLSHDAGYTHLALPSTEVRRIPSKSFASVGMVSNPEYRYQKVKNAGSNRLKGKRPKVRGTAMNPVDHPHGGGEGRTGRGMKHPKTPWGKPALGVKTRKKKWSDKLIVQRRKKKKRKK
ncbi:50S ribosomal protein L2 [Patescibacteria group bacterium]|nr:50S ribosomal protein L2 [Patescibacteria group bacterium]